MTALAVVTVVVTGFVACAEFGSYAFVHPVLRRLPTRERIVVEKGLLRTFGRVMPPGMILCVLLAVTAAVDGGTAVGWAAAAALVAAVTSTVIVNVPINIATGRWDPDDPPVGWSGHARAGSGSRASGPGCCWPGSCSAPWRGSR